MSRGIVNAEDTCLIYRHDAAIPTPHPLPPWAPPHHLEDPALTSADHTVLPPPFHNIKPERAPEPPSTAATNTANTYDEEIHKFPEGGARAWSVTAGSFCALFAVFGVINTTAVFQEYFSSHQLRGYRPGQIGWIFSLSLFLTFFCGNPIGPFFDAKGPRGLVVAGSGLLFLSMMLLGECTSMWLSFLEFMAVVVRWLTDCRVLALRLGVQYPEWPRRLPLERPGHCIHRALLPGRAG